MVTREHPSARTKRTDPCAYFVRHLRHHAAVIGAGFSYVYKKMQGRALATYRTSLLRVEL